MKSASDPRHLERQKIVQELFAGQALHRSGAGQAQSKVKSQKSKVKTNLFKTKTEAIFSTLPQIDKLITECAPQWQIEKINQVDLAVLRLAVYELVFARTEPPKVIMDEAIELAREFGAESAPGFVNGVLAKVLVNPARTTKLIADRLGIEADLQSDLNATDLEIADLLTYLEKELNFTFEPEQKFLTVGDILSYIEDHHE